MIWLDLDPGKGHEQKGRRPALVLSSKNYNNKTGLALVAPITSKSKQYLFEVPIKLDGVASVVLADHSRNISWRNRNSEYITGSDNEVTVMTIRKLIALLTNK